MSFHYPTRDAQEKRYGALVPSSRSASHSADAGTSKSANLSSSRSRHRGAPDQSSRSTNSSSGSNDLPTQLRSGYKRPPTPPSASSTSSSVAHAPIVFASKVPLGNDFPYLAPGAEVHKYQREADAMGGQMTVAGRIKEEYEKQEPSSDGQRKPRRLRAKRVERMAEQGYQSDGQKSPWDRPPTPTTSPKMSRSPASPKVPRSASPKAAFKGVFLSPAMISSPIPWDGSPVLVSSTATQAHPPLRRVTEKIGKSPYGGSNFSRSLPDFHVTLDRQSPQMGSLPPSPPQPAWPTSHNVPAQRAQDDWSVPGSARYAGVDPQDAELHAVYARMEQDVHEALHPAPLARGGTNIRRHSRHHRERFDQLASPAAPGEKKHARPRAAAMMSTDDFFENLRNPPAPPVPEIPKAYRDSPIIEFRSASDGPKSFAMEASGSNQTIRGPVFDNPRSGTSSSPASYWSSPAGSLQSPLTPAQSPTVRRTKHVPSVLAPTETLVTRKLRQAERKAADVSKPQHQRDGSASSLASMALSVDNDSIAPADSSSDSRSPRFRFKMLFQRPGRAETAHVHLESSPMQKSASHFPNTPEMDTPEEVLIDEDRRGSTETTASRGLGITASDLQSLESELASLSLPDQDWSESQASRSREATGSTSIYSNGYPSDAAVEDVGGARWSTPSSYDETEVSRAGQQIYPSVWEPETPSSVGNPSIWGSTTQSNASEPTSPLSPAPYKSILSYYVDEDGAEADLSAYETASEPASPRPAYRSTFGPMIPPKDESDEAASEVWQALNSLQRQRGLTRSMSRASSILRPGMKDLIRTASDEEMEKLQSNPFTQSRLALARASMHGRAELRSQGRPVEVIVVPREATATAVGS